MREHNFVIMDSVSPERLDDILHEMFDAEHYDVYDFDSYEYFWEFGCDVFDRLRDFMYIYKFDIRFSRDFNTDTLMGLPIRVTAEPTKRRCVSLLRINPKLTRTFSYIKNLNKEDKTMRQEDLRLKIDPTILSEYVDTDMAASKVAWNQMNKLAIKRSIKNVIFNDPATIVFWSDGSKTVVKAEGESFDPEKGLAMAIAKKSLGNEGNYYEIFREWLPKEEVPEFLDKKINLSEEQLLEKADDDNTDILTARQLAEKTGLPIDRIQKRCREGRYPGAMKVNNRWLIPYSGLVSDMDNFDARR